MSDIQQSDPLATIFYAEDDDMVRSLATRILEKAGYQLITATDGQEAIDILESQTVDFDLAILDVVMPRVNGQAVYQKIRELGITAPVLFSSGYSESVLDEELRRPEHMIQKPYSPSELLERVQRKLAQTSG